MSETRELRRDETMRGLSRVCASHHTWCSFSAISPARTHAAACTQHSRRDTHTAGTPAALCLLAGDSCVAPAALALLGSSQVLLAFDRCEERTELVDGLLL